MGNIEISVIGKAVTMSSLEIAKETGKRHAHIMRDIRNLLAQGVSESNFGLSYYEQAHPKGGTKRFVANGVISRKKKLNLL